MVTTALEKNQLRVAQFIKAGREEVYQAWTQEELVRRWLCPEDCKVIANEADVRPGGTYQESMRCGDDIHTVAGTYREIIPNKKLVFTHEWQEPGGVETLVTVEFKDLKNGTEVILTQDGFEDAEQTQAHQDGWTSALRNLVKLFHQ